MAAGFKYFSSSDAGAPVLSGVIGAMVAVLDWALDTTDAINGWEIVFTATGKRVYRSRYGVRPYLRVSDDGTYGTSPALQAGVFAYETMSDIDTGTNVFPVVTGYGTTPSQWRKSTSTVPTNPRRYWGIKTAQFLLLCVEPGSGAVSPMTATNGVYVYWFGQVPSLVTGDVYPIAMSAMMTGQQDSSNYGGFGASNVTTAFGVARSNAGNSNLSPQSCFMRSPDGSFIAPNGNAVTSYSALYSISTGEQINVQKTFLVWAASSGSASLPTPSIRAILPNIWTSNANIVAAGWAVGDTFKINGYNPAATFIYVGISGGAGHVFLETTDTSGAV